jgi:NAD kinase
LGDQQTKRLSHLYDSTAPNDWFDVINQVLNGKIGVEERMRLDCFFTGQNGSGLQRGDTNGTNESPQRNMTTSNSMVRPILLSV